jgi:glucose-6-phosphate 1-epimerase
LDQTPARESFPDDLHGLPGLRLSDGADVFITRQGAQVLSWRTADGRERLYLSPLTGGMTRDQARHAPGSAPAIRGGIPVCFPQFSDRGGMVKHGFARSMPWQLSTHDGTQRDRDGGRIGAVALHLGDDPSTQSIWPHAFGAALSVTAGPDHLTVSLSVTNRGATQWEFTAALHTYLRVDDVRNTAVAGLGEVRYQDATAGNAAAVQQERELRFAGEVDRVYLSPPKELQVL